jgi:ComF family protein
MPKSVWEAVRTFLFPSRCLGCGRRDFDLCPSCRDALPRLSSRRCPFCAGIPNRIGVCERCATHKISLDGVRVEYVLEGATRKGIHRLKYGHGKYLAPILAELALESLAVRPIAPQFLVPVPIGPKRQRKRGYNQSELLAQEIGLRLNVPVLNALMRVREGRAQVGLNAMERRANVRGAFELRPGAPVAGKRLLLIDDVMTTGATLDACARILKGAGAASVVASPVARET